MGGVVSGAISWVFGTVFYFTLGRVEDVVTWLLPIYMTVQVLRHKESIKFNNYLSFWCIASLLFGIDYISGFLLHNFLLFRLARVIFLIWIFIEHCHNSVFLVNRFLTPVIDEHRSIIEDTLNKIDERVQVVKNEVTSQVTNRVGGVIKDSQGQILTSVMTFASNASKSVTSMISNAEEADTDSNNSTSNNNSNSSSSSSDSTSDNTNDTSSTDKSNEITNPSDVTTDNTDNKEVES